MGRFIIRRLIMAIPVLIGVSIIAFLILHLAPGDPAEMLAGEEASQEDVLLIRHQFGLDKPLTTQYFRFIKGLCTGDLLSIKYERSVTSVIGKRLRNTMKLAMASITISIVLGIFTGVLSAVHRYTWIDYLSNLVALLGLSMPVFWWALLLMMVFSVHLMWLPSGGIGGFSHYIMPAIVLGTASTGIISRLTRSSMLDVLRQDYITTARAKGLVERFVIYRHALRNALIPTVTVIGMQFGRMLAGAVITESVFSWPGLGRLMVTSILCRDYPVVQSSLMIVALIFVMANLVVDVLYAFLDPRIRDNG